MIGITPEYIYLNVVNAWKHAFWASVPFGSQYVELWKSFEKTSIELWKSEYEFGDKEQI